MFRSMLIPGWGQSYNGEGAKGVIIGATTLSMLTLGVGFEVMGILLHFLYFKPYKPEDDGFKSASDEEFIKNLDTRHDITNANLLLGGALIGGAVCLWVYNVADAYLSGVDGEEMLANSQ